MSGREEVYGAVCRVVQGRDKNSPDYLSGIRFAKKALRLAEKYMWKLNMDHPDFDQMMAQTERLRFEVQNLENE